MGERNVVDHLLGRNWSSVFALLFALFDVEAAYLYAWAIRVGKLGTFAFVEMAIFIGVLTFGLGYAWRKGGLQWE